MDIPASINCTIASLCCVNKFIQTNPSIHLLFIIFVGSTLQAKVARLPSFQASLSTHPRGQKSIPKPAKRCNLSRVASWWDLPQTPHLGGTQEVFPVRCLNHFNQLLLMKGKWLYSEFLTVQVRVRSQIQQLITQPICHSQLSSPQHIGTASKSSPHQSLSPHS